MTRGRTAAALVIVASLAVLFVAASIVSSPASDAESSQVRSVSDGDTLRLSSGERVRLVQVDAPELTGDECYSRGATAELERLAPAGTAITLVGDPALDDRDRFGRLLRYVFVGDLNINLELVRRGAVTPYFFHGDRGRHAPELLAAAHSAQAAHRGLWGACPSTRLVPTRAAATG